LALPSAAFVDRVADSLARSWGAFTRERGLRCSYTGVDVSQPLLDAAETAVGSDPSTQLIQDDICQLSRVEGHFDIAFYSHTVEMMVEMIGDPEASLQAARRLADRLRLLRQYDGVSSVARDTYEKLFSDAEQDRFNLLTLDFRYPFPFDLPTLAHFYRSSRVFAHFALDDPEMTLAEGSETRAPVRTRAHPRLLRLLKRSGA
jgi:hypothetical protein